MVISFSSKQGTEELCTFNTMSVLPGLDGFQENLFSMVFFYIINPVYKLTEDA